MKVLGVSGSPIPDSNTDRAVKIALEETGLDSEFIKLKDYTITPCNACLGCVKTNKCVNKKDDGIFLAEKAKEADALIIGCFTPYSSIDSRTKAFLERLYPLRHVHGLMRGKPGGAIVTCANSGNDPDLPPSCDMAIDAIKFYMMEESMNFLGAVKVIGNVPCIRCGKEEECTISGLKMLFGPVATLESVGINRFEDQPDAVKNVKELANKIRDSLIQ